MRLMRRFAGSSPVRKRARIYAFTHNNPCGHLLERLREDNTAKQSHIEELIAESTEWRTRYEAKETLEAKEGD